MILKVKKTDNKNALMEDGRTVRLGGVSQVAEGDYLEVYADVAFMKIDKNEAAAIRKSRSVRAGRVL